MELSLITTDKMKKKKVSWETIKKENRDCVGPPIGAAKKIFLAHKTKLNHFFCSACNTFQLSISYWSQTPTRSPSSDFQLNFIHSLIHGLSKRWTSFSQSIFTTEWFIMISDFFNVSLSVCARIVGRKFDEKLKLRSISAFCCLTNRKFAVQTISLHCFDSDKAKPSPMIRYFYHWCTISSI